MMTALALWALGTQQAQACPSDVAGATIALEEARLIRQAAYDKVHHTDWDYLLALGDRDQVLDERKQAGDQLKDARGSVKISRQSLREVEGRYTSEERTCTPEELDAAKAS